MPLPYQVCMLQTAHYYHLPFDALPSIQAVEGGAPGTVHHNIDGTDDLGVMQINTRWVQPLAAAYAKVTRRPMTMPQMNSLLVVDPCFNIAAAGLILQAQWVLAGHDWLAAVGNYHSHTPQLHRAYLDLVMAHARLIEAAAGN